MSDDQYGVASDPPREKEPTLSEAISRLRITLEGPTLESNYRHPKPFVTGGLDVVAAAARLEARVEELTKRFNFSASLFETPGPRDPIELWGGMRWIEERNTALTARVQGLAELQAISDEAIAALTRRVEELEEQMPSYVAKLRTPPPARGERCVICGHPQDNRHMIAADHDFTRKACRCGHPGNDHAVYESAGVRLCSWDDCRCKNYTPEAETRWTIVGTSCGNKYARGPALKKGEEIEVVPAAPEAGEWVCPTCKDPYCGSPDHLLGKDPPRAAQGEEIVLHRHSTEEPAARWHECVTGADGACMTGADIHATATVRKPK